MHNPTNGQTERGKNGQMSGQTDEYPYKEDSMIQTDIRIVSNVWSGQNTFD